MTKLITLGGSILAAVVALFAVQPAAAQGQPTYTPGGLSRTNPYSPYRYAYYGPVGDYYYVDTPFFTRYRTYGFESTSYKQPPPMTPPRIDYYMPEQAGFTTSMTAPGGGGDRPDASTAIVEVRLPREEARVWFDGAATEQTGTLRTYVSPSNLTPGRDYRYSVRARWTENGQPVEQNRDVVVRSGERARVDFTQATAAPEEPRRSTLRSLPPPRPRDERP